MTESSIAVLIEQLKYISQGMDEVRREVRELKKLYVPKGEHTLEIQGIKADINEIREATRFRGRRIQTSIGAAMLSAIGMAVVWLSKLF